MQIIFDHTAHLHHTLIKLLELIFYLSYSCFFLNYDQPRHFLLFYFLQANRQKEHQANFEKQRIENVFGIPTLNYSMENDRNLQL